MSPTIKAIWAGAATVTCAAMLAFAAGCQTDRPDPPKYDTPFPITEQVDPVTGKTTVTR